MAPTSGSASTHIDASPEAVYDLVADVTRMGEWSPETTGAHWVGGATGPEVGARFRGSNRKGLLRWSTDPVVEVADRGRCFAFTTSLFGRGRFTRWTYALAPGDDGGTDVEESWEQVNAIPVWNRFWLTDDRVAELQRGMEETLARLKAAAEAG